LYGSPGRRANRRARRLERPQRSDTINPPGPAVRLAHLSDVHVSARGAWRPGDWLSKRLTSWANLRLRRARQFAHTEAVLATLAAELRAGPFDRVVFSGDATALGFEAEVDRAARLLGVAERPGLAVPGNHDYLTHAARRSGAFERAFAPWLIGERVDDHLYPFAQRVGHVALVAVSSAVPHRWPTDASGAVGADQLARLDRLLEGLPEGPRVLVTHYPVWTAGGQLERRGHGLRDLEELVRVAARGRVGLWLHGHNHEAYHHGPRGPVPFPTVCAGSATQAGRWSYGDYTLSGSHLRAVRRAYDAAAGAFREVAAFEVCLPG
jgi:3',5'-cyclic AMP phosphodiesterase CpdA